MNRLNLPLQLGTSVGEYPRPRMSPAAPLFLAAAVLFFLLWPGGLQAAAGVDTGDVDTDAELLITRETLVLARQEEQLNLLAMLTLANRGDEVFERVELPLPGDATEVRVLSPEGEAAEELTPSGSRLIDTRPLAPGEERSYSLMYSVPGSGQTYVLAREVLQPTETLIVMVPSEDFRLREAEGFTFITQEELEGIQLNSYGRAAIEPGTTIRLTFEALASTGAGAGGADAAGAGGEGATGVGGAGATAADDPGTGRLPGPAAEPIGPRAPTWLRWVNYGLVAVFIAGLAGLGRVMLKSRRSPDRPAGEGAPPTGVHLTRRGVHATAGDLAALTPPELMSSTRELMDSKRELIDRVARLDLAFEAGELAETEYRSRREACMERLDQVAVRLEEMRPAQ